MLNKLSEPGSGHVAVIDAVDDNQRPQGAGPDTINLFERELKIAGGLARLNLQLNFSWVSNRGEPRTWHAVPMHMVQTCSPRGLR